MRLNDLYQHLKGDTSSAPHSKCLATNVSLLVGGPGAGKTSALKEMRNMVKDLDLIYTSTTNAASQALGGKTIHSLLSLPIHIRSEDRELIIQKISSSILSYYMNNTRTNTLVLVIDEAFILDAYTIDLIVEGISVTNRTLRSQSLGVIKIVLCGDPAQLLAINGDRFYHSSIFNNNIPIFRLEGIFRQSTNTPLSSLWGEAIHLYRTQGISTGIINWITESYHQGTYVLNNKLDFNPSSNSFIIAFTNELVRGVNLQVLFNHCEQIGKQPYKMYKEGGNSLYLAEGCPIFVTGNDREKGIFKRQRGTILRIESKGSDYQSIIARIDDREVRFKHEVGKNDLPLTLAYAGTVHTAQGATLDNVQILVTDLIAATAGAFLVCLTRHVKNLSLVGIPLDKIGLLLDRGVDPMAIQYV
jgi:ATP-dependent exoDNAse (exonuclease V) alpha subunit